jgi:hypothetical protein
MMLCLCKEFLVNTKQQQQLLQLLLLLPLLLLYYNTMCHVREICIKKMRKKICPPPRPRPAHFLILL